MVVVEGTAVVSENEVHLYPQNPQILQSMLLSHIFYFACLELHNCAHFLDKMQSPENRISFINKSALNRVSISNHFKVPISVTYVLHF